MVSRVDRAKLFVPFDALKGLQEILREKEKEVEERKELSEETLMELQEELNKIEIGSSVFIKYYKNKRYIEINGSVTKINFIKKKIIIDADIIINMCDIIELKVSVKLM